MTAGTPKELYFGHVFCANHMLRHGMTASKLYLAVCPSTWEAEKPGLVCWSSLSHSAYSKNIPTGREIGRGIPRLQYNQIQIQIQFANIVQSVNMEFSACTLF